MVTGKAEIWGHRSVLERLAVPRPVTRISLVLAGGVLGQIAWSFLTLPLMAYLSGVAASFCLLCLGAVWGMREKAEMVQGGDHLSAKEFKSARGISNEMRRRSTWRAALVAVCALVAAGPVISHQFTEAVWQWMMISAGVGVGEAAYAFLLANAWEEQLRAKRDQDQLAAKELAERQTLIDRLESSSHRMGGPNLGSVPGARGHQYRPH